MAGVSPARDRILIVDDEQSMQYVISELIAHMGHEAVVAGNGKEGMKSFGRSPFDLVITDLEMPEADGLALAAFIKERSPHTPVVLITGNGLEAVQEGAVDVVVRKPFTRAELENTVHTLLHREDRQWVRTHPQGRSAHGSI